MTMVQILILVLALCMDTFVASIAYGTNHIKVSLGNVVLMNGICSGCLGLALLAGGLVNGLVPESLTRLICCICLFLLGVVKLLDYSIKRYINRHVKLHKDIRFSISGLSIIVNIYGNPMAADWDQSQSLSWKETVFLSLAMSIDSLVAGTLAAFLKVSPWMTVAAAFVMGIAVMYAGLFSGRRLAAKTDFDLGWLSGILFLVLGLMKL